jgi:ABC-type sugar transport system ATPase subunit
MQTKRAERLELVTAARERFLRITGVDKVFSSRGRGALKAVDNVSLEIQLGEFVSIVGPSGCGKSTLMMMVSGLVPTTSGEIIIDAKNGSAEFRGFERYVYQRIPDLRTIR